MERSQPGRGRRAGSGSAANQACTAAISVAVVFVGTHPFQAELRRFYSDLVSAESRWFSVLGQYSSGPLSGQVDDVISRDGLGDLDPGQFVGQALLARPRHPNAATYVALHLGSDVSYDAGGCALHFSARVDNQTVVRVGVVPFASASTCVRGLDALASVQQASAHELAEAITNGVDGESAWSSHGFEAADLCNGQTESVVVHGTEHTLHRIWSNCDTACVVASECATRS
ncbi:hypothetical protein BC830DRAFT_1174184 [Chytriomyces sp. MP71]|nr:hypothetical protein BC830DRAFT_1174184 [Chytriomyces sp. MP71]